jgi:hypothetical protein
MDELTLLRELDAEVPEPEPRAMYAARSRLRHEIAYERDRPSRWQAPRMFATAVVTAAAVAVGAVVLGGDEAARTPETKVQLTAAGEFFTAAARDAAAEAGVSGAVPRDDQFLYRREILLEGRARFVSEFWQPVNGEGLMRTSERGRTWETAAGWMRLSYAFLDSLPTDPGELVVYARSWPYDGRDASSPMTENDYIQSYVALMGILRENPAMPGDLRAAIFEALARIPGIEMTEDEVDARGRHGVGFKAGPRFGVDIVDPDTYEYLGMRGMNEGVEQRSAVVERAVVDRLGQRP